MDWDWLGFVKLDDTTWTVYDIPGSFDHGLGPIECITIDSTGDKWVGVGWGEPFSWAGLMKYDDESFTFYDDPEVLSNGVRCIAIDEFDNKWIGTDGGGLVKCDGTNWTVYDTSNSGLPTDGVECLAIDESGNKWIGTVNGLAVFNEGGIVSVEEKTKESNRIPTNYLLNQNYPNPFNPVTIIEYSIPSEVRGQRSEGTNVTLKIYDILGREIATLVNEKQTHGNYEVSWDASNNPSGIYFYRLTSGDFTESRKMMLLK